MRAKEVECRSYSKLTVDHLTGEFQVKNDMMKKYYHKVMNMSEFKVAKVEHIRREKNARADLLSKLTSIKNKNHYYSVIQMMVPTPSITSIKEVMVAEVSIKTWMTPIIELLKDGECDKAEESTMKHKCVRIILIGAELYQRKFSRPLLKYVDKDQDEYILDELHQGICSLHSGGRNIATKALRVRYYWASMESDSAEYVKKCHKCQEYENVLHTKPKNATSHEYSLVICSVGDRHHKPIQS